MFRAAVAFVLLAGLAGAQSLPDLTVDAEELASTVQYDLLSFPPTDCALQAVDLCVRAPGARRLLRFGVFTPNVGQADLVVGVPQDELDQQLCDPGNVNCEPKWVFSSCHNHYHFQTFARYELRRQGEQAPLLEGQKRSFCVEDTRNATASTPAQYCCNFDATRCPNPVQGISVGWGDLYPSNLPCQWIDVTDGLDPGDYDLCVFINTRDFLVESDYANNSACVPVHVDAPPSNQRAPKVKVLAPKSRTRVRAGGTAKIAWQRKPRGELKFQEIWFSTDGGTTYSLVADTVPLNRRSYRWSVPADAATETARLRVIVWNRHTGAGGPFEYQRTIAESAGFRIIP